MSKVSIHLVALSYELFIQTNIVTAPCAIALLCVYVCSDTGGCDTENSHLYWLQRPKLMRLTITRQLIKHYG